MARKLWATWQGVPSKILRNSIMLARFFYPTSQPPPRSIREGERDRRKQCFGDRCLLFRNEF